MKNEKDENKNQPKLKSIKINQNKQRIKMKIIQQIKNL
jgi:hypothetical protein